MTSEEIKLSRVNGDINKMSAKELSNKLEALHLDTTGRKEVLKRRLKTYHRLRRGDVGPHLHLPVYFDNLIVIDFEATCDTVPQPQQEIIEFPAVLIDCHTLSIQDVFHAFCKPIIQPKLSSYCCELTGVLQSDTDSAQTFSSVLADFDEWRKRHSLGYGKKFAIVTDGSCDISKFLLQQCLTTLPLMLETVGLELEGRLHCGKDDALNIASLTLRLMKDGAYIYNNERLEVIWDKEKKKVMSKQVIPMSWKEFSDSRPRVRVHLPIISINAPEEDKQDHL
ncbi:unnamed protein product [Darwinula stevensoni]|uniref:SAP domain-containing protein n=1 Tax=Darwinula stevensoni TaxID=69355 RepID=A0A7R8XLJ2_9CRUS|nr:unnamed protein product [Darwinula stevensoni]CAG0894291.1 unnamed protein product [Darwinula stevensoni]